MIVIGLGTGRSGTASLASLLSAQKDGLCFHELNPACIRFSGTPRPIYNTIDEFQAILNGGDPTMLTADLSRPVAAAAYDQLETMPRVRIIGDVAFYYLTYVRGIVQRNSNVRFLCLRRDIDATVASWLKKSAISRWPSKALADRISSWITREPFHDSYNYWVDHDGSYWQPDPVWDKCFPKFDVRSKIEAIRQYCNYYYAEAALLAQQLPEVFRYVDLQQINEPEYQKAILDFIGIEPEEQVITHTHEHQSARRKAPRSSSTFTSLRTIENSSAR